MDGLNLDSFMKKLRSSDLKPLMKMLESCDLEPLMEMLGSPEDMLKKLKQQRKMLEMLSGESTSSTSSLPSTSRPKEYGRETKGDNKEKKKKNFTRLEKQIALSADSRACMEDEKYDEAYGLLASLMRLGEGACFVPVLINYYKTLISTGRIDESAGIKNELIRLIAEKLHSTPEECERLADKYRLNNEHIKALLFYQVGAALYTSTVEKGNIVNCLQGCMLGFKISISKLLKRRPDLRYIVTPYIVPAMRLMYEKIRTMKASQPTVMTLILGLCLHHIETTELKAENPTLREGTLKEAVALFEEKFGDDAKKHKLFNAFLNNLGVTYYSMHRPHEAMEVLNRAMEARRAATDYEIEFERSADVAMTQSAIESVEEMIKFMEE